MTTDKTHLQDTPTRILFYFDALTGAGKTYRLADVAIRYAQAGRKVIICMIGVSLIEKTYDQYFKALHQGSKLRVARFHNENGCAGSVKKQSMDHFQSTSTGGEIIMITHAGFRNLEYIQGRGRYHLIIDEAPCPSREYSLSLPETHSVITNHLRIKPSTIPGYSEIEIINRAALRRIAQNTGQDAIWKVLRDVADDIANRHVRSYVRTESFEALVDRKHDGKRPRLTICTEWQPSAVEGFREVVLCSALCERTLLYQSWVLNGVDWQIQSGGLWSPDLLRYREHQNGALLTIYYALEQDFSKALRAREIVDGRQMTVIENIVLRIEKLFAGELFLYSINRDLSNADEWDGRAPLSESFLKNGTQLSGSPHGLNDYTAWHNVAIISAINPSPQHFAFQSARGIDPASLKTAMSRCLAYQTIARCSLRDPTNSDEKKCVVMDRGTAEFLSSIFPGARMLPLPALADAGGPPTLSVKPIGRPAKHETSADRQRAYRDRRKQELLDCLNKLSINNFVYIDDAGKTQTLSPSRVDDMIAQDEIFSVTKPLILYKDFCNAIARQIRFPLFRSRNTSWADTHWEYFSPSDFLDELMGMTSKLIGSKDENLLISTTHFVNVDGAETKIGRANVAWTFGIWFDFDGDGDLTPEIFAGFFPNLEFAIYATHSSTREKLRWRAYFPTTLGMDSDLYGIIQKQLVEIVNQNGFWSTEELKANPKIKSRRRHGFDPAVWRPEAKIYLPCVPADPAGAYSALFRDDNRGPIDVAKWIDTCIDAVLDREQKRSLKETPISSPMFAPIENCLTPQLQHIQWQLARQTRSGASEDAVQRALETYRSRTTGTGHQEFWRLACRLSALGLDDIEMRQKLVEAADSAKRRKEIDAIMRRVRSRGMFKIVR